MSKSNAESALLDKKLIDLIKHSTGASRIAHVEIVQSLWSGFGQILRIHLEYTLDAPNTTNAPNTISKPVDSTIVKRICPPVISQHPRGWDSDRSAQRKLRSYEVETCWYENHAFSIMDTCPMPRLLASDTNKLQTTLLLEDLDTRFPRRHTSLDVDSCVPCLRWLARFHAHHLGSTGKGLWPVGSYWHLQTRADEFAVMADSDLKQAAAALDAKLNNTAYQSLVHGDAKVANMCFSENNQDVAMVDFQYVGKGCGMRDVAYFLGSCLDDNDCERHADKLLALYFTELTNHVPDKDKVPIETQWRALYSTAWADFHRFLAGWMPEHGKINRYMQRMTDDALKRL